MAQIAKIVQQATRTTEYFRDRVKYALFQGFVIVQKRFMYSHGNG
jgi:hypothetical protein